jgi:hypothetical protein
MNESLKKYKLIHTKHFYTLPSGTEMLTTTTTLTMSVCNHDQAMLEFLTITRNGWRRRQIDDGNASPTRSRKYG